MDFRPERIKSGKCSRVRVCIYLLFIVVKYQVLDPTKFFIGLVIGTINSLKHLRTWILPRDQASITTKASFIQSQTNIYTSQSYKPYIKPKHAFMHAVVVLGPSLSTSFPSIYNTKTCTLLSWLAQLKYRVSAKPAHSISQFHPMFTVIYTSIPIL